jgi:hypothetical protein
MTSHTIEPDVITVLEEKRRSGHQKLCGRRLVTRKNPHAIAVGLNLELLVKP